MSQPTDLHNVLENMQSSVNLLLKYGNGLSEIQDLSESQIDDLVYIIRLMKRYPGLKTDAELEMLKASDRAVLNQAERALNHYIELIAEIRAISSENSPE